MMESVEKRSPILYGKELPVVKICKDFLYGKKRLSDMSSEYICVEFDSDSDVNLAMSRSNISGETNLVRREPNDTGTTWDDVLEFEFHIVKNPCTCTEQKEREITKTDIREITRWLTSITLNSWLDITEETEGVEATRFLGKFNDIQTWSHNGVVFGLKLFFRCSSQFGFTEDIVTSVSTVNGCSSVTINNDDDEMDKYVYPVIDIAPLQTGQVFFCNLSDAYVFDTGYIDSTFNESEKMDYMMGKIGAYANGHGYTVEYLKNKLDDSKLLTVCNNTAILFKYVDTDKNEEKCIAYYNLSESKYYIIHGAFMYLDVKESLPIHIDCQKLMLYDDLNRMIKYEDIGVDDEDYIYFLRYINGDNNIVVYGNNCTFTFTHREARKTGGA